MNCVGRWDDGKVGRSRKVAGNGTDIIIQIVEIFQVFRQFRSKFFVGFKDCGNLMPVPLLPDWYLYNANDDESKSGYCKKKIDSRGMRIGISVRLNIRLTFVVITISTIRSCVIMCNFLASPAD